MKKAFSYITIAIFLLVPTLSHAASTPVVTSATTAQQKTVQLALSDSYTKLSTLSSRTQLAINQLNINGIDTSDAQDSLIAANANLDKAKVTIAAFAAITLSPKVSFTTNLNTLKTAATTAEDSLNDAKSQLI